jgi:hypothetical protein
VNGPARPGTDAPRYLLEQRPLDCALPRGPSVIGAYLDHRFADHDAAAARIRDAYLAGWSAWAGRAELARAFDAAHDVAAVAVAAGYRRYPPAVAQAHPWMREMPAFCLNRILARRAAAAGHRE